MMMQTEPCERQFRKRQVSNRLATVVRGIAAVLAVGVFAPILASGAHAERTIAHTRPRPRQTLIVQTEHARSSNHSHKAGNAKAATTHKPAKGDRAASKTVKPETHAKSRSQRRSEPVEEPEPVVMHRARAGRAHVPEAVRVIAHRAAVRPSQPAGASVQDAAIPDASKALTVDDFVRAASPVADDTTATNGKVYVRGESRTELDDRLSDQPATVIVPKPRPLALKPVAKRSPVVAKVEANPTTSYSEPLLADDAQPADLAGAPLVPSADRTQPVNKRLPVRTAIVPLPPLSRQEVTEELEQPVVLPGLYRNGRLVVPAPLKGTHEILVHQNLMADDEGLERIEDEDDLRRLRAAHLLVDFPESASLHINPELGANRRCARVWSVRFATTIARDFYARFHEPLQVNSAVRTVAYQVRLQRTNGNAAGIDGDTASPHLTGQAMDLGKRGMSAAQIAWMRSYLLPLMQAGKIDVEEEFQQACFHISVYRTYMPAPTKRRLPRNEVAALGEARVVKSTPRSDDLR
jgi:hypothetical protein